MPSRHTNPFSGFKSSSSSSQSSLARSDTKSSTLSAASSKSSIASLFTRPASHHISNLPNHSPKTSSQRNIAEMLDDDNQAWGRPRRS